MNLHTTKSEALFVPQGEFRVAAGADVVLTTLLGSCVAACIWDAETGVGGMNHIVLPDASEGELMRASAGANAMELLINGIGKQGGSRARLQAKLFGGASMIAGLSNVGARNSSFAREFLERENIPCVSESLGGTNGRRVQFWPATGRVRQKFMSSDIVAEEERLPARIPPTSGAEDVELFLL